MTLSIGDLAPDFTLATESAHQKITLSHLRGKKIILFFYPKDNTPGCTKEACHFRDEAITFNKLNTEILGISKDGSLSHTKFKEKYQLPFHLLADDKGTVCDAYGVFKEKSIFGKTFLGINRSTFLIDEAGIIRAIWRNVKVSDHVEQVKDAVKQSS